MINNAQLQSAWIYKLKANANVTAHVPAVEIRENSWKGERFSYPNIRVKMLPLTPTTQANDCNLWQSGVSILVFVEEKSSKTADEIAGVIATEFWRKTFTVNNVRFTAINLTSLDPAEVPESDENSWMASVNFECLVSV